LQIFLIKKMINKIIIIIFCVLTLIIMINSSSFQKSFTHFVKTNDEMYSRVGFLIKLHKAFRDTSKDNSVIRFIYPMDYLKRKQSYFNNSHSFSRFYGNNYWVFEKGNELYNLDSSNIYKINELTSKFLLDKNINLNNICKKVNYDLSGNLITSKNVLFFNENSFNSKNQIIKLNYKFRTTNLFSSINIYDASKKIVARSEVDLSNTFNSRLLSYSNKIINSNNNIVLLEVISKYPSNVLLEIPEIEIILFKKNNNNFSISFEFYNDKDEFYNLSDVNNHNLKYKIASMNSNYFLIEKNINIINCKS